MVSKKIDKDLKSGFSEEIPDVLVAAVECERYGDPEEEGATGPLHQEEADRDHLGDGLDLAHPAGGDVESLAHRRDPQAGDEKFPGQNQIDRPGRGAVEHHQPEEARQGEHFVGERVEDRSEGRDLVEGAGDVAVEEVGGARQDEEKGCGVVEPAVVDPGEDREIPVHQKEKHQRGDQQADEGEEVGDVIHEFSFGKTHELRIEN